MKQKFFFISLAILFSCANLLADNVGAGLGRVLMGGNSDKMSEFMATSSNHSCANQYCAITSGTSGYQKGAVIGYNDAQQYLEENMDLVARDMARGEGEYLETFIELMELDNKQAMKLKLRQNFDRIYTHKDITSGEVITNIIKIEENMVKEG